MEKPFFVPQSISAEHQWTSTKIWVILIALLQWYVALLQWYAITMNIQPKMKEFAILNPIEVLKNSKCGIVYKVQTIMALKV